MKPSNRSENLQPVNLELIVHSVRDRIAYAIDYDERRLLGEICTTFGIIEEASYGTDNYTILIGMGELEYVAREGVMGAAKKEWLPSHEKIALSFTSQDVNAKQLSLEHILHSIRDRIEQAIDGDDRRLLERIATALTVIYEAAYKTKCKSVLVRIQELRYLAKEATIGFYMKERLPSHQKITDAFE